MRDQLSEEGKRELLAYTLSLADVIRASLAAEDPDGARKDPDAVKRRAAEIADNVTGLWEAAGSVSNSSNPRSRAMHHEFANLRRLVSQSRF